MSSIIDIGTANLIAGYLFVLIVLGMMKIRRIGKELELIIAVIRMTIQLILVGYLLEYIFGANNLWLTFLAVAVMETFAIRNVYQRVKVKMSPEFRRVVAYSMAAGTLLSMIFFFYIVINLKPWYSPRYIIPLAGMLIGNSMTGITLGTERLLDGVKSKRYLIEGALMLGATPEKASRDVVNNAFTSAILPTINSMVGMGIVFLPGMMTGQILSGTSPLLAIEYQIAIMLGILGSVALTVFIMISQGIKTFFNTRAQLRV